MFQSSIPITRVPQETVAFEEAPACPVHLVETLGYYISFNVTSKELSLGPRWCDTGCARGFGG